MKLLVIIVLSCIYFMSISQTVVTPSKGVFEKKWIRNVSYQMNWYALIDSAEVELGLVTIRILKEDEKVFVITSVNLKNDENQWIDTTVAHSKTLKPVRHSSLNSQRNILLNFVEVVTGYYQDKQSNIKTAVNDTIRADYFDSNFYPLLIGWLPLKNNYRCVISIYDYNPLTGSGLLFANINHAASGQYQSDKSGDKV